MGSYLNFNPAPYNYNRGGNNNLYLKPSNNPEPHMTTLALGEEGGGGYNSFPFTGGFNPQPYQFNGGGFNFMPFPAPYNPNPQMTTYAMGEEGGGGYNPPPPHATTRAVGEEGGGGYNPPQFDVTTRAMGEEGGGGYNPPQFDVTTRAVGEEGGGGYNPPPPPPVMTTQAMGEEGGGGYNPPRPEPFRRPEPPALISIDLSVAQKVHKTADGLDGNMNNIADTKQLRQLRQDLETIALPNLKSKLNPALSPAEQKELQGLIKSTEKEIEAIDFMINNAPTLAGEPYTAERWGLDGNLLPRVIKFDALQETANKVSEDPNRVLLTDKDVTKPIVF